YWTQFLANRGYVVLQMNFRGSAGYGAAFQAAGYREWGEAMQDDIEDGARWLVSIGVADPARLAIMGGSYGGYAALMGLVKTPNLFQCGISINGVTDLPDLLRHDAKYVGGRYATRHIGNLYKDRKKLAANSPARNAKTVRKPVLLLHGDQDRVVPIAQSNKMARALRGADKDVRYVKLEDGDHSISLYENRMIFLDEVEKFLGPCLGAS
ncbi:MAG: prolyl oligopeptidase family serine peptidase, partial [Pseudomonadota bacterium]